MSLRCLPVFLLCYWYEGLFVRGQDEGDTIIVPTAPPLDGVEAADAVDIVAVGAGRFGVRGQAQVGPPSAANAIGANGVYLGGILQPPETQSAFNARTQVRHAAFLHFIKFPEAVNDTHEEHASVSDFLTECKENGAMAALTVMTDGGLHSYSVQQINDFADFLNIWSDSVPIWLRFNHEMNGSWYSWGQQPALYKSKFEEFSRIIKARTTHVAMVWTPNYELGFPWPGEKYSNPSVGREDPYWQFFPNSSDTVDWIGMSYYHWGDCDSAGALGCNVIPQRGKFYRAVGQFYNEVAARLNKPMMVSETSSLFHTGRAGASEIDIKSAWLQQVYGSLHDFPLISAVFWFNIHKDEPIVGGDVDWCLDRNEAVTAIYREMVHRPSFIQSMS
ncbi:unnamed protein product [Vitrella brassicaformis CCMP3155]|uniref:GH26 domain-containing protein n=1 Tax=Vitrella brassicaformis (strain CCMP3155) TaxID=1169540 RepID=A0A0G4EZX6_VITBC|nr:unnamed protein product [Vitrella brassicaformis CCMP3155]|eukprot:CEM04606.1 unnamed protein product [Vitrella brassicaformis CCMP3155]